MNVLVKCFGMLHLDLLLGSAAGSCVLLFVGKYLIEIMTVRDLCVIN